MIGRTGTFQRPEPTRDHAGERARTGRYFIGRAGLPDLVHSRQGRSVREKALKPSMVGGAQGV